MIKLMEMSLLRCAYEIRKNLNKGCLLITNALGHTKILRNEEVIKKSINFIKQNT